MSAPVTDVRELPARRRRRFTASVAAIITSLLLAVPVSASVFGQEHYAFDYEFTYDCDSVTITVVGQASGVAHLRIGKGEFTSAFYSHDNYQFSEVHSNAAGESLTIVGDGLFQETKATHVEGTIYTFTAINAGRPFIVYDADGNVIARDRGTIRETILFDTLGDDTPGGTFLGSLEFDVAGPHDGLGFDTCSILG